MYENKMFAVAIRLMSLLSFALVDGILLFYFYYAVD